MFTHTKTALLVSGAFILNLALGVGLVYYFGTSRDSQSIQEKEILGGTSHPYTRSSEENSSIVVPGGAAYNKPWPCTTEGCFNVRFPGCQASSYTKEIDGYTSFYYEIQAPTFGACSVLARYATNRRADFVGPTMVCVLDNKKTFDQAWNTEFLKVVNGQASRCTGDLVHLLHPGS